MIKILIISLIIQANFSFSLATKLCKITSNIYTGSYDSKYKYTEVCERLKCEKDFSFQCTNDFCSSDKLNCNSLYLLRSVFSETNRKYFKNMKECSTEYSTQIDDICMNEKNCFYKINSKVISRIVCPCLGRQSFKCGHFCTKNSLACDALIKNNLNSTLQFNKCGNGNVIIRNNLLFHRRLSNIF